MRVKEQQQQQLAPPCAEQSRAEAALSLAREGAKVSNNQLIVLSVASLQPPDSRLPTPDSRLLDPA